MKTKKRMNKILKILLLFFLLFSSALFFNLLVKNSLVTALFLCAGYALLFALFGQRTRFSLKDRRKGALTLLFFLASTLSLSLFLGLFFKTEEVTRTLLSSVVSVVLIPVCEELFYRATVFSSLEEILPTNLSVFLSSLLFALVHTGVSGILTAFFAGILLSFIYKKEGSVLLPILCHAANNLVATLVIVPTNLQGTVIVLLVLAALLFYKLRFYVR